MPPTWRRAVVVLPGLAALLAASCVIAVKTGQVDVTWSDLASLVTGEEGRAAEGGSLRRIVVGLRVPRVLLGAAVGACLAAAGTVFQGVLRNPLADPFLLGLSGGASLGAAVVILGGMSGLHVLVLPAAAMAGALLALLAVSRLASGSGSASPTTLILAGVMVSAFCSAAVMFLTAVSPSARVHGTLLWMMGSLAAPPPGLLSFLLAAACLGVVYLSFSGHHLNVLSLGEETAQQIGVTAASVRWRLLFTASLLTAVSVAASGLIGFVGLVVPHALRNLAGADHRLLIPAAALAGGAVLVLADCGARIILPPAEIPVGVITALFGAPFFLVLLRRRKGWMR